MGYPILLYYLQVQGAAFPAIKLTCPERHLAPTAGLPLKKALCNCSVIAKLSYNSPIITVRIWLMPRVRQVADHDTLMFRIRWTSYLILSDKLAIVR